MFSFTNISKSYAKSSTKAVTDLNLTVNNGEIFGFLGPNGAGKTTTIKMLTGIIRADTDKTEQKFGRILIDGIDMEMHPQEAKRHLSFVPDTPELFSHLKAAEYLNFVADVYGVPSDLRQSRVKEYTSLFSISDILNSRISSFSHGMKQKLFLTASLVSDPQNWILDEPMVGLDPEAAYDLKELMRKRAAEGKTIFFSTHVMEVAEKLCSRIGIIKEGKLIFTGSLDELRQQHGKADKNESLEDIFLHITGMHLLSSDKNMEKEKL